MINFTKKACGSSLLRFKAVITIEAALCIPLIATALILLIMPLKIFDERRKLQTMLEIEAEKISDAMYIGGLSKDVINQDLIKEYELERYQEYIQSAALITAVSGKINKEVFENIRYRALPSEAEDKAMINLNIEYNIRPPVNFLGIDYLKMSSIVSKRAFVGSSGGRGREKYSGNTQVDNPEDRLVYVGRNRSRYHLNKSCHYIFNDISSGKIDVVRNMVNKAGKKYKACSVCYTEGCGTVYYFDAGSSYHGRSDCRSLNSYVETVRLSEVKHLGACSYCGSNG